MSHPGTATRAGAGAGADSMGADGAAAVELEMKERPADAAPVTAGAVSPVHAKLALCMEAGSELMLKFVSYQNSCDPWRVPSTAVLPLCCVQPPAPHAFAPAASC